MSSTFVHHIYLCAISGILRGGWMNYVWDCIYNYVYLLVSFLAHTAHVLLYMWVSVCVHVFVNVVMGTVLNMHACMN